jgi:hypothetical protein
LGAGTHKDLNRITKIGLDQLYLREENLSFNKTLYDLGTVKFDKTYI